MKDIKELTIRIGRYTENIYKYVITFCALCIITLLIFYNAAMTSYLVKWEVTYYVADSVMLNVISVLILVSVILYIRKSNLYTHLQNIVAVDEKYKKIKNATLLIIFFICVFWVVSTQFIPGVDEGEILQMISDYSQKNYDMFAHGGYLDRYHHNIGLFWYEYCMSLIFGTKNYIVYELVNSFAITMLYKQLSEIGGELGLGRIGQLAINMVGIIFLPVILYAVMIYGNIIGVALSVTAVKYELQFFKNLDIKKALICSICISMAVCFKSTVLIYFLAIVFFALMKCITIRKKEIILMLVFLIVGFKIQSTVPVFIAEKATGYELDSPVSFWIWTAMGLQESELAPGWWNGYEQNSYWENGSDIFLQKQAAIESVKNSVEKFVDDPKYAFKYFSRKISSTWANPSFQCFATVRNGSNIEYPKWVRGMLSYRGQRIIMFFLNPMVFCILFGALFELILGHGKKSYLNSLILPMILIGGFAFLIFWETKARYALLFFVPLIPFAVMGYSTLIDGMLKVNKSIVKSEVLNCINKERHKLFLCLIIIVACFVGYGGNRRTILVENTDDYYTYLEGEEWRNINNLNDYLQKIDKKNYSAFFAVKDIQGFCLTEEHIRNMKKLGFNQTDLLLEHAYHNFIGVIHNGNVIYEYVGDDELSEYEDMIEAFNIKVQSGTLESGDIASIMLNGTEYAVNGRGINIVIFDNDRQRVLDSVAFDTHISEIPCSRN